MRRVFLLVMLALSFSGSAAAQTANVGARVTNDATRDVTAVPAFLAIEGTWQVNVAKSTFSPGPAPNFVVPMVRQYVPRAGGSLAYVSFILGEQGVPYLHMAVVKPDGKDYPAHTVPTVFAALTGENPKLAAIAMKVIDDHTIESTVKNPNGVVNQILTLSATADGKTLTEHTRVMNAQGQVTATNVLVYERKQ